jgi:hypothetical protein
MKKAPVAGDPLEAHEGKTIVEYDVATLFVAHP